MLCRLKGVSERVVFCSCVLCFFLFLCHVLCVVCVLWFMICCVLLSFGTCCVFEFLPEGVCCVPISPPRGCEPHYCVPRSTLAPITEAKSCQLQHVALLQLLNYQSTQTSYKKHPAQKKWTSDSKSKSDHSNSIVSN